MRTWNKIIVEIQTMNLMDPGATQPTRINDLSTASIHAQVCTCLVNGQLNSAITEVKGKKINKSYSSSKSDCNF